MSFADTHCPCGGRKPTETMLCDECIAAFADHPSMAAFKNASLSIEARRHAATVLLTLSRKRKHHTTREGRKA